MSGERSSPEAREVPIDDAVLDRTVDHTGVDANALSRALVELNAALIGRHPELERDHDYVTVDGVRAYRVSTDAWGDLVGAFELDEQLVEAAEFAHTEQARLLFADAVEADDRFADDARGVVVGVDTAEEF